MLGTDTLRILRTVARSSRMFTVQVWCKHSLFQVSCGLRYAPEYVHCFEYRLTLAAAYSHNATSKMSQVSCSIPIYSLRNVGKLKTVPFTQLLLRWHIVPRYRCCQTILYCSYLVKWEVQSFLYEPRLRTNAKGLDDHKSTVKCAHIFWPHLQVLALSKTQIIVAWTSGIFQAFYMNQGCEATNRLDEWDSKQHIIILKLFITKCWYQSQMLARAPLRPCLCLLVSLLSNNSL